MWNQNIHRLNNICCYYYTVKNSKEHESLNSPFPLSLSFSRYPRTWPRRGKIPIGEDRAAIPRNRLSPLSSPSIGSRLRARIRITSLRVRIFAWLDSTRRVDSVRERSNGGGNVCPLRYRVALIAVRECSTCLSTHSGPVDKSVDRPPLSFPLSM